MNDMFMSMMATAMTMIRVMMSEVGWYLMNDRWGLWLDDGWWATDDGLCMIDDS